MKPTFKRSPSLGAGILGKVYYESILKNTAQFFIDAGHEGYCENFKEKDGEKVSLKFVVRMAKISRVSYEAWIADQEKAMRSLEKLASFEEKTKDPSELMTAVVIQGNTLVKNDFKGLELLENTMGEVTNI